MRAHLAKNSLPPYNFYVMLSITYESSYWEDLAVSPTFSKLSEVNQTFILENTLGPSPAKTMSTCGGR